MKKKIFRILFWTVIVVVSVFFILKAYPHLLKKEDNLGSILPGMTGDGCDLTKEHLEYNVNKGIQECVEGESK